MPAVMHQLDAELLACEVNSRILDNLITNKYLSDALIAPSLGCDKDYERLEFLGTFQRSRALKGPRER